MSDVSSEDLQEAKLDRYGFIVSHKFLDERKTIVSPAEMRRRSEKERERTNKWVKMIKQWDLVVTSKREKLKRRIRKGIPDMVRGTVWYRLAHCDEIQQKHPDPRRTINVRSLDPKIVDEVCFGSAAICSQFFIYFCTQIINTKQ